MTNEEMLRLAARAVEIKFHHIDDDGVWWRRSHMSESVMCWNPLKDDGDALRLAVKMDFNLYYAASSVFVEDLDAGVEISEGHEQDKLAATRRAIVRAAAEIGKAMP